jgi:poly(A) polymerase
MLAGRRAWLVGGAVRDRLLRAGAAGGAADLDVVLEGDPREAARALARASSGAAAFVLSEEYGGWRVVARDGSWQIDFERLRGDSLEEDLALRDFTVNAIAEPLGLPGAPQGETIDPLGGLGDLAQRRLRAAGPRAFADDPLRVLRLVRLAVELELEPDDTTRMHARTQAANLGAVAPERVFTELCRIIDAPRAVHGLHLMGEVGATAVVLPELEALRGVAQSRYHHLDVYGHTLEVLQQVITLQANPAATLAGSEVTYAGSEATRAGSGGTRAGSGGTLVGSEATRADGGETLAGSEAPLDRQGTALTAPLTALLAEPLADGLTRGGALRWGALLHDAAKPLTREVRPGDGRVTFIGHDVRGAELATDVLRRHRSSSKLQAHVAALVRHHLRLGFLVHEPQPLARRTVFAYLRTCEPVELDVTLLSVADRLATRGDHAQEAIAVHLRLAERMLDDGLRWRANGGPPRALWRGDELARELGIPLGPRLGELLEELALARYAGEVTTPEQALEHARKLLNESSGG